MSGIIINPYNFGVATDERFITKWTVGAGQTITLWSVEGVTSYSYDVDWGDGNSETGITTTDKTHDYTVAGAGTYTVSITGQFGGLKMYRGSTADRDALVELVNWGTSVINSFWRAYYQCQYMVYSATDAPDLSGLGSNTGYPGYSHMFNDVFYGCDAITDLDLSSWSNTNLVTQMSQAFRDCTSLQTLNLTDWNTSNVTTCYYFCRGAGDATLGCDFIMPDLDFSACSSFIDGIYGSKVKSIDVTGWTLRAAGVNLQSLFNNTKAGSSGPSFTLDCTGWSNTSGITNMYQTFRETDATSIDITGIDTSNVPSFGLTFYNCANLTHITGLNGLDGTSTTTLYYMFYLCEILDFGAGATTNFGTNWGPNLGNCTQFTYTFTSVGLTTPSSAPPNVANWDVTGGTAFTGMFQNLKWTGGGTLDVSSWNPTSATTMLQMFYLSSAAVIDTSAWEIPSSLTNLQSFVRDTSITTLDFSDPNCDLSGVTNWSLAIYNTQITRFILHASSDFSAATTFYYFDQTGNGPVSTPDYDAFLLRLAATNSNAGVTLNIVNAKYTGGGAVATARAALITLGWTITDGGIA